MPNVLIQTPRGQMPCYLAVPLKPGFSAASINYGGKLPPDVDDSLDPLLTLLAARGPKQIELAFSFCLGWFQVVLWSSEVLSPTPAPLGSLDALSNSYCRVCHGPKYCLSGQSLDCFGTNLGQAQGRLATDLK